MVLVRESCDVQCDGVTGPIAAGEKALAADCAADRDCAQRARRVAQGHCVKLAFDTSRSTRFVLLRAVQQRAFEHWNPDRRVAKFCTLRQRGSERQPIVVGVRQT